MFATVGSYGIKYLMGQADCFCTASKLSDKSVMLPSHAAAHTALRHIFMLPQLSSYSKSCNQVVILQRTKFGKDRLSNKPLGSTSREHHVFTGLQSSPAGTGCHRATISAGRHCRKPWRRCKPKNKSLTSADLNLHKVRN